MIGVVALFSQRTMDDLLLAILFSACATLSLFYRNFVREKRYVSRDRIVTAKRFQPRGAIRELFPYLESKVPILAKMRRRNEGILSALVPRAGVSIDTEKIATQVTRVTLASTIPCTIAGIVLGIHVSELLLAICAAPIAVFFAPYINIRLGIMERKTRVEEEMAYFLSYVNIMQHTGFGLYHAFDMIRGHGVFRGLERDASEIIKRVKLIGITQNQSLEMYAESHPSQPFREFISGYVAKITSVGDVPGYTESKAKYFFDEYIGKWKRYEKSATEIFGAVIMIAVVLPMMIMLISTLSGSESSRMLLVIGSVISPVVSVMMIVMLNSSQPATGTRIRLAYPVLVAGAITGISAFLAGIPPASAVAMAGLVGASVNYIIVRKDIAMVRTVDSMMPEFMRDVTELSKTGQNINQIVLQQSAKRAYKKDFNDILSTIAGRVRRGDSFDTASQKLEIESTHVRFIMFILSRTYMTGGGNPDIFNMITEFISKISLTKSEVTKSLRSMSLIVYFSPFLMLGISQMMIEMFAVAPTSQNAASTPFSLMSVDQSVVDGIRLMTAFTMIPIGAVTAKITSYTVKDTMPVAIVSLCTILALYLVPEIFKMVSFT